MAEKLRSFVFENQMDALTEAYLMFAARHDHWQQVIDPHLMREVNVISDRFIGSTLVYQCRDKGLPDKVFRDLLAHFMLKVPHQRPPVFIQFVLDVDYETATARMNARAEAKNRLDFKTEESFNARRLAYVELAQPGVSSWASKTFLINAAGTEKQVMNQIIDHWNEELENED